MTVSRYILIATLAFLILIAKHFRGRKRERTLDAIPTIGATGPFSFITNRWNFLRNARDIFQEGYDKYRGGVYKVQSLHSWMVAITSPKLIEDMRKIPDEYLSSLEAVVDLISMDYTVGKPMHHDPYQVSVVKGSMTRNITVRFSEVRDEIVAAFSELLPPQDAWVPTKLNPLMAKIICRASNRFFVGLPLCRNEDYIDLNVGFAMQVAISGQLIGLFPDFIKPIAGKILSPLPRNLKRANKHLGPLIQERFSQEKEYGTTDWPDKPNDLLSWLLDVATGSQRTMDDLTMRVLAVNFGAIHTTLLTLTSTLNYLCRYPQYIDILRAEIETVTEEHGWTKQAMGRMRKFDSFLKEVQRVEPAACFGVLRKVMKDYTFADGTTVPTGVTVGIPIRAIQRDDCYYPDGNTFNGLRFYEMREGDGESLKHQMVTPTSDYFLFGSGRHACPGRFFAVNELKALVAHMLLTYDIKVEREGGAEMKWLAANAIQDNDVHFLFRKRHTNMNVVCNEHGGA
ncbi:hypothetical protein E1B28_007143 [Marasmius oreades]|uniref:Cytochrome P450 n=1 Tax=Marasmius oreades TaxID=181124 RepID=A0A9P7UT46_9AGAR|nr:uncharacterized protein E1B28_007143 [Marasmius oreades]KAG7093467.1 hypothetical protein E1B28_007143 [Marasmius oreades]